MTERVETAAITVSIVEEPIRPEEVIARTGGPADGALLLFLGVVRDRNEGRPVESVRYEAYREMAESELRAIAGEAVERWPLGRVAVVHRLGELPVGEASVAVAISSGHRAEAFDAARWIMEELKVRAPIWKHERYSDGESAWLGGEEPRE
jgi:molybdopterin synthase catalytic subunit